MTPRRRCALSRKAGSSGEEPLPKQRSPPPRKIHKKEKNDKKKKSSMKSHFKIFILLALTFTGCYGCILLDDKMVSLASRGLLVAIVPIVMLNTKRFPGTPMVKTAMALMLIPFLSIIPAYLCHQQTPIDTFIPTFAMCTYMLLPLMYILKIREEELLKSMIFFGPLNTAADLSPLPLRQQGREL